MGYASIVGSTRTTAARAAMPVPTVKSAKTVNVTAAMGTPIVVTSASTRGRITTTAAPAARCAPDVKCVSPANACHLRRNAVCCDDQCVSLCPGDSAPDPQTCECGACNGQIDGTECDAKNQVCCQQECVSTQCHPTRNSATRPAIASARKRARRASYRIRRRVSVRICAATRPAANAKCDPTSGDCVPVDNGTDVRRRNVLRWNVYPRWWHVLPDETTLRCYDQTGRRRSLLSNRPGLRGQGE